jgi:hypothetical protein
MNVQSQLRKIESASEVDYRACIVSFFCLVFGNKRKSAAYANIHLPQSILRRFPTTLFPPTTAATPSSLVAGAGVVNTGVSALSPPVTPIPEPLPTYTAATPSSAATSASASPVISPSPSPRSMSPRSGRPTSPLPLPLQLGLPPGSPLSELEKRLEKMPLIPSSITVERAQSLPSSSSAGPGDSYPNVSRLVQFQYLSMILRDMVEPQGAFA